MFKVVVHDTPITIMADSGASVNVLDETKVKIHPYKSSESLTVLGKFTTTLKFKSTCITEKIYVVQGSGGSLRGLAFNKSKCEYGKGKVGFLGYLFSGDSVTPDPIKIEDIINLQTPTSAS